MGFGKLRSFEIEDINIPAFRVIGSGIMKQNLTRTITLSNL